MATGYTGSDGNIQEFQYTPVDPTEDLMRQAFERSQQTPAPPQPQGPTPYWENPATYYPRQQMPDPIEQQKAATAAAYKYIAFRGYQNDLKEGKSAADAFAKWGPMLVQDVSFAPAMKALTPTPQPTWMPANATTGQPGAFSGRVTIPPMQGQETIVQPNANMPGYIRDAKGGIHFAPQQTAPRVDQLSLSDYNAVRKEFDAALKASTNPDLTEDERTRASAAMKVAKVRMDNIRKGAAPQAAQQSTQTATTAPETPKSEKRIHVKDAQGKDWTIPEWQVDLATKQGFTVVK